MAKLSPTELKSMLASARASALGADTASTLSEQRAKAQDYYYGDMSDDLPSAPGRSSAVSTDVSDTIEGLMPSLMEIFAGGDEVVKFEPVGPEDVEAATQETDYVNHVFLQLNQGFLVLYGFIKDALLSKNGFVKVFWEEYEEEDRETYLDQPDDAFAMIAMSAQAGDIEIVEHTAKPVEGAPPDQMGQIPQTHDVTVVKTQKYECAKVVGVPPEEFGIERNARCIKEANYCFHQVTKTQTDLIDQGYDQNQINKLPIYAPAGNIEAQARDTVEESPSSSQGDEGVNKAIRLIRVTEHYIRMDYERNGKANLYRVTTGGEEAEVLRRDGKPDIEQVDMIPFASMTPIIVPHRFFGRSIADIVIDIQKIKTALLRSLLDNTYMANNPRPVIAEANASVNTLDDLLVSRHGAPIRVKTAGGLDWMQVPTNAANIAPVIEYFDGVREWRTGVTKQGQGIDAKALQNQSATAVNQAFTASQARMKLIARIMAETGIRDLFSLLHGTIRKHGSKAQTVRLKNKWVEVDPRDWKNRNDLTINVGLGNGGKAEQLQMMQVIAGVQEKLLTAGKGHIVQDKNLYSTAKALTKIVDQKDVDAYFSDPDEKGEDGQPVNPPPPPPQDPKVMQIQMQAELDQKADERKAQIEQVQAQADMATQDRKTQAEMAQNERDYQLKERLAMMQAALEQEKFNREEARKDREFEMKMAFDRQSHEQQMRQSQFGLAAGAEAHQQKMEQAKAKPQKGAE